MKYFYYAVQTSYAGKKNLATVLRVAQTDNLLCSFNKIKNISVVMPCSSKKQADFIVATWNSDFIKNGTYLYDYTEDMEELLK